MTMTKMKGMGRQASAARASCNCPFLWPFYHSRRTGEIPSLTAWQPNESSGCVYGSQCGYGRFAGQLDPCGFCGRNVHVACMRRHPLLSGWLDKRDRVAKCFDCALYNGVMFETASPAVYICTSRTTSRLTGATATSSSRHSHSARSGRWNSSRRMATPARTSAVNRATKAEICSRALFATLFTTTHLRAWARTCCAKRRLRTKTTSGPAPSASRSQSASSSSQNASRLRRERGARDRSGARGGARGGGICGRSLVERRGVLCSARVSRRAR